MVSAMLSPELKERYNRGSLNVRKGDTVKIMRGDLKGHKGEVMKVDLTKLKIYVHGVTSKKADGKDVERPVDSSNVQIVEVSDEDKVRRALLSRKVEDKPDVEAK